MSKTPNLQDAFLASARRDETPVTVFLMNGFQMRGVITGFDAFTVVLMTDGRQGGWISWEDSFDCWMVGGRDYSSSAHSLRSTARRGLTVEIACL